MTFLQICPRTPVRWLRPFQWRTQHGTAAVLADEGPVLVEIVDEANWENILNVDAHSEHAVEVFPAGAPSVFARNDLPPPPPEPPPARAKSPHQESTSNVPFGESSFTDFPPFRKGRRGLREHRSRVAKFSPKRKVRFRRLRSKRLENLCFRDSRIRARGQIDHSSIFRRPSAIFSSSISFFQKKCLT